MKRCTARSKRSGERCKRAPAPGRQTCRLHGGASPVGIGSATFKSGRYSKVLPAGLLERYAESLSDPNLLELREDVAALDARLLDLLARVDAGGGGAIWKKLADAWQAMLEARARGDNARMMEYFGQVEKLIAEGDRDRETWAEIRALWQERRKLVESERKRLVEQRQVMTSEQAATLMAALADSVRRHVSDRTVLKAISEDLERLTVGAGPIPLRNGAETEA